MLVFYFFWSFVEPSRELEPVKAHTEALINQSKLCDIQSGARIKCYKILNIMIHWGLEALE